MDIQEVLKLLPHRYPFLLVDRVRDCLPGKRISGFKNITKNEPFFRSPSRATSVPRLLLLEAMAQVTVVLTFKTLNLTPSGTELMFFAGIDDAQFLGDAVVGDRLDLEAHVTRIMPSRGIGKFATTASVGTTMVARASMIAAIRFSS
jgi:3-hydroxyacyl-[acyl-carrier-protein] dehydratase